MARRSRKQRKDEVRQMVEGRDWQGLLAFDREESDTGPLLLALAFDLDDRVRWRAIEGLGRWSAEADLERVRNLIRRVLWLMNDESGGLAWHGPEVIGEILANAPALIDEYGRIVASFIHEDPFGPGAAWAMARLAPLSPETFDDRIDDLTGAVESSDPALRGYGLLALASLRPRLARKLATQRDRDQARVWTYERGPGEPSTTTVAALAQRVLDLGAEAA